MNAELQRAFKAEVSSYHIGILSKDTTSGFRSVASPVGC